MKTRLKEHEGFSYATAEEMVLLDELVVRDFGIEVLSLMENAGVATAGLARQILGGDVTGKRLACLVGQGNNGGDGLVAARHLHNWGAYVTVILAGKSSDLVGAPSAQLSGIRKMVTVNEGPCSVSGLDLVIDALLGCGARGKPREPIATIISQSNASGVPTLALDLPSGLDPTTGVPNEPCIAAKSTLTLGLPKLGFLNPLARRYVGDLHLADISVPPEAYARVSALVPDFRKERVVRIW